MSEKLYLRRCEKYTIWEATAEPIEVDVDKLRKCEPHYKGSTTEELWTYIQENILDDWDMEFVENEHNKKVYGEDELYSLLLQDGEHETSIYSDSREKFGDDWVELGHKNEEYRKTGHFQSLHDNGNW